MTYLGDCQAEGVLSTANRVTSGAWVVTFTPEVFGQGEDFEVYRGAAEGPGGFFKTYMNGRLYGNGENGLINEFGPSSAMFVRRGSTFEMHWSIATGSAPLVVLYMRTPRDE